MRHLHSILRNPFIAMTLIAGAAATSCVDASDPGPATDQAVSAISGKQVILNETGASRFSTQDNVLLVHSRSGDVLVNEGTAWKSSEPGIWESTAHPGAARIIIGAEGHRRAIARAESDLSALHHRAALHGADAPAVATAIQQQEAQLKVLKDGAKAIQLRPEDPGDGEPVCSVEFLIVPSSPYLGFSGVIGAAQAMCSSGCATFTIQSTACTDLNPCVTGTASNFVCATPWVSGVGVQGTAGAPCAAGATITPPGVTGSSVLPCG